MPRCLALHGIKPRGSTWDARTVEGTQWYLLEVVTTRDRVLQEKWEDTQYRTHPWEEVTEGRSWPVPKVSTLKKHLKGRQLREYVGPVLEWLEQLRWYDGPRTTTVSAIELAIDFEETTGVSLGGEARDLSCAARKARRLHGLMKRIKKQWDEARDGRGRSLFPAEAMAQCHALRSIGGKTGIGWDRRACFASDETAKRLKELGKVLKAERMERLRAKARGEKAALVSEKTRIAETKAELKLKQKKAKATKWLLKGGRGR
eukprot:TRINITY_DN198_c2_g3_i1.p1 TRINITY_DN198_c2_g3~~TRINITY_DN198_c2_g3_i1.p1  ORF type:complete len:260 (-),score=90.37 TRINITY_DN198_c2_g3_i1:154-933(-)